MAGDIILPRFTKRRNSEVIEIEEEDGSILLYSLKELQGAQREEFIREATSRTNVDSEGNPIAMKDGGGLQVKLISMCLHDPKGELLKQSDIAAWPSTIIMGLFAKAQKLSGLDKKATEREKKD